MKKQIITMLCVSAFLISNSASAAEISKSFKGFNFNIKTPTTESKTASKTAVNKAAMKAQISSIKSKINSTSSSYQSSVDNLANNLLPTEQLKKLNEEKAKIKDSTKQNVDVNIEIAEDGTIKLNKFLKSSASKDSFKNLTLAQKTAIKRDINNLRNINSSYIQIAEQSKTLLKQIKSDPIAALELKADLTDLVKTQVNATKQAKSTTKLLNNLATAAAKAGVTLQ